jgi:hypothetical protein
MRILSDTQTFRIAGELIETRKFFLLVKWSDSRPQGQPFRPARPASVFACGRGAQRHTSACLCGRFGSTHFVADPWLPQRQLAQPRDSRVRIGAHFAFVAARFAAFGQHQGPGRPHHDRRCAVRRHRWRKSTTTRSNRSIAPCLSLGWTWRCSVGHSPHSHLTSGRAGAWPDHSIAYDVASISARIRSMPSASIDAAGSCCGSG